MSSKKKIEFTPVTRTVVGIAVTKDFEDTDKELQRICHNLKFDQSKVIKELIRGWCEKMGAIEKEVGDTFYMPNIQLIEIIQVARHEAVTI